MIGREPRKGGAAIPLVMWMVLACHAPAPPPVEDKAVPPVATSSHLPDVLSSVMKDDDASPWMPSLRVAAAALTCPWDATGFSMDCGAFDAWIGASASHPTGLLWRLIHSPSASVRFLAASALLRRPQAASDAPDDDRFVTTVQVETDNAVGGLLASLLVRRASTLNRDRLLALVREHPLAGVRIALASDLLVHGGQAWANETFRLAASDPLERVRLAAMGALRFVDDPQAEKACAFWRDRLTDASLVVADRALVLWEVERRCGDLLVSTVAHAARARLRAGQVTARLVRTLVRLEARGDVDDPKGVLLGVLEDVALSEGCAWSHRRAAAEAVVASDAAATARLRASPRLLEGLLDGLEGEGSGPKGSP
jgi:hypothetical protein